MSRPPGSPTVAGRAATPNTDWMVVTVVVACGVVAALQVGKVSIALPALRADLGLDLAAIGWVMGVFALLGVFGGIPVGVAVSRVGDRLLLMAGLLALALGSAAGAHAHSLSALLVSRTVEGAGFLLILVAAPAAIQRVTSEADRDIGFGYWGAFMPVGIALALLAGPLIEGWRMLWLANAVLAGATAALVFFVVPREAPQASIFSWFSVMQDARATATSRGPLLLSLSFALYALQYFAVVSFLPVLLVERMAISVAAAGALSAVAVGVNILGNLAAGELLSRGIPHWRLIAVASVAMGASGIGIFMPGTPHSFVFLLCMVFSGVGGLLPATVLGGAVQLAPAQRLGPISLGLTIQGNNLGQLIGPAAVGAAVQVAGWPAAAVLVGAAGVMGTALALGLRQLRPP